ncbi:MAG TPA: PF20097 family protein [Thermoanaerobaculia bacterium]|jgi:hypothetical protein
MNCPECDNSMVEGTLADYRHRSVQPAEWMEGHPESSVFGTVKNEERFEVTAYRCTHCGCLKLYAAKPATSAGKVYS